MGEGIRQKAPYHAIRVFDRDDVARFLAEM